MPYLLFIFEHLDAARAFHFLQKSHASCKKAPSCLHYFNLLRHYLADDTATVTERIFRSYLGNKKVPLKRDPFFKNFN